MKKVGYIDGYLLLVPKDKLEEYKKVAHESAQYWLKHGAISVRECVGDDLTPDMGDANLLQFPSLMNASDNEAVWYSYIEYESKEERDRINAAVHKDMIEHQKENPEHMSDMPFEMHKMVFGGFKVEV